MTSLTATSSQVTASQLDDMLERNDHFTILDVRNEKDFGRSRIEGHSPLEVLNIPYFAFVEEEDAQIGRVPTDKPIVVVCAKGESSQYVTQMLRKRGLAATNLRGGIAGWGEFYRVRKVPTTEDSFTIYQLSRVARGDLSYAVSSGDQAVVVDPTRHIEEIIGLAEREGFRIVAVLDTHVHADHISGGVMLGKATGAPYYLHPYDGIHPMDLLPAAITYEHLWNGFVITFNGSTLRALHIPGHTLGNMAFLVNDRYLLSGDSIFLRSIARPDLGGRSEEWGLLHYDSIYGRLLKLPDETIVLPGHFSHSREARVDGAFYEALGKVKRANVTLQFKTKEAFLEFIRNNLPDFPPEYAEIKRANLGLAQPTSQEADELEAGKNECALK